VARANGFSLHAGVSCEGHQKEKRERLCRYIAHPAVAVPRLSLSSTGKVVYTLKTPYSDGTTQVAFDPVDLIARLAAPVRQWRLAISSLLLGLFVFLPHWMHGQSSDGDYGN
jgi:hypothetical protein